MGTELSNFERFQLLRDSYRHHRTSNLITRQIADDLIDSAGRALQDMGAEIAMLKSELAVYLGREVIYTLPGVPADQVPAEGHADGTILRSTAGTGEWVLQDGAWVVSDESVWEADHA